MAQISHGSDVGSTMMTLVPAVNDYSNTIFSSITYHPGYIGYKHYANVIVLAKYFQPTLIYLHNKGYNQTLQSYNWASIVVNGRIEAYATQLHLNFTDEIFRITHYNNEALISAIVYGFNVDKLRTIQNTKVGYGHPTGLSILEKRKFTSINNIVQYLDM